MSATKRKATTSSSLRPKQQAKLSPSTSSSTDYTPSVISRLVFPSECEDSENWSPILLRETVIQHVLMQYTCYTYFPFSFDAMLGLEVSSRARCRNLTFLEVKAILPREISPILKKLYEEKHIASCRKHLLALEKLAYSHSVADETFEGARDDLYASWSAVMKELEPLLQEKPGCYVYSEKLKRYVPAKYITTSYYMDDPAFRDESEEKEDPCSVCAGQSSKCSDCVQWERAKEIGIRSFPGTNLALFPNYYAVQPILCFEIEETEELVHVLLQQVTFNSNEKSDYCKFMRKDDAVKIKIALAVDILKELQYWMGDITLTLKAFGAAFEQLIEQERAHISPAFATAVTNILECIESGVKTRNLTGIRPVPPLNSPRFKQSSSYC